MSNTRTPSVKVVNAKDLLENAPAITAPPLLQGKSKQSTALEDVRAKITEKQEKQKPAVVRILNIIKAELQKSNPTTTIAKAVQDPAIARWASTMFFTQLATVRRNNPDLGEVKHFLIMCNDMLKKKELPSHLKLDDDAQRVLLQTAIANMPAAMEELHDESLRLKKLLEKGDTPKKIEEVVDADLVESLNARIAQLESERQCTPTSNFRTETSTAVEDRMALADTVTTSMERVDELQKALAFQQDETVALRVQNDDLQSQLATIQASTKQLQAQDSLATPIAALRKENEAFKLRIQELEGQMSTKKMTAHDSLATPPTLQPENANLLNQIRELQTEVSFLRSQLSVQSEAAKENAKVALVNAETLREATLSTGKLTEVIATVSEVFSQSFSPLNAPSRSAERAARIAAAEAQYKIENPAPK